MTKQDGRGVAIGVGVFLVAVAIVLVYAYLNSDGPSEPVAGREEAPAPTGDGDAPDEDLEPEAEPSDETGEPGEAEPAAPEEVTASERDAAVPGESADREKAAEIEAAYQESRKNLSTVTVENGIDSHEAHVVASHYFHFYIGDGDTGPGAGGVRSVRDGGEVWLVEVDPGRDEESDRDIASGHQGPREDGMTIDKKTGAIEWPLGPPVGSPEEMLSRRSFSAM
jgi:hypothetical protein